MKWPFDLKYLSKILFQLTRPPEDWTFPSSWMHTTIWSNHSQCISLYIYKTLRSFWDLNNLDFCTVSTLTCHDENSFLKKKKFRDETPWGTNPIPLLQGNYDKIKHCIHSSLQLSQLQIRPNKGIHFDIQNLSFIRKCSYTDPNLHILVTVFPVHHCNC